MTNEPMPQLETHQEQIVCPNCWARQTATVEHTVPFFTYVHHCAHCHHVITEPEWEKLAADPPTPRNPTSRKRAKYRQEKKA